MWCRLTLLVRVLPDENALPRGGLPVDVPLARVVLEHDCLVADRLHVLGRSGIFPPPPGASITKWGTASPEVHPRSARMISRPFSTVVRKCSAPATWSHM